MSSEQSPKNLPAPIADALSEIPKAFVPATLKALDRLVGAAVGIPVAKLEQIKARIEARTEAIKTVELAVAAAAAAQAAADRDVVDRAVGTLLSKAYRQQQNREAVGAAAIEERASAKPAGEEPPQEPVDPVDEEWLNVFERYAQDASTERMQKLWGRVLAGQIRKPGRFSMRTLRFLSEFSQEDAIRFAEVAKVSFGESSPKALLMPEGGDIRPLMAIEAAGLINGVTGLGVQQTLKFGDNGIAVIKEGPLALAFRGAPNSSVAFPVVTLTPVGTELLALVPDRNPMAVARTVATSLRRPELRAAMLAAVVGANTVRPFTVVWDDDAEPAGADPQSAPS